MDNPYAAPDEDERLADRFESVGENNFVLASRWRRLFAIIVEYLFFCFCLIVPIVLISLSQTIDIAENGEFDSESMLAVGIVMSVGVLFYALINCFLIYHRGQGVGKLALGIRVVTRDFRRLSALRYIFVRSLPVAILAQIPLGNLLVIIEVLFIFRAEKNCIHDDLAGSRVVNYRPIIKSRVLADEDEDNVYA